MAEEAAVKIASVVGARPQFIKCALISRLLRERCREVLIHTGQHYDYEMSQAFFEELDIPEPDYNLNVGSSRHGKQTGEMLEAIERVLLIEGPCRVVVYGDTNSTLAGALAAVKLHIPVAHVEAGLRSFNRRMPEEINRVLTDHISDLLFCPTDISVKNLAEEGIKRGVHKVGDVMYDLALRYSDRLGDRAALKSYDIPDRYYLATIHRAENTDDHQRLGAIIEALSRLDLPVVLPIHPRTVRRLRESGLDASRLLVIPPVSYINMLRLIQGSTAVLTDSGGLQKEAFFLKRPCVTLRDETEWIETVESGWNRLAGASCERIIEALQQAIKSSPSVEIQPYGDGSASSKIVDILISPNAWS